MTTFPRISVRALLGALPAYCVHSETSDFVSSAGNPLEETRSPTTLDAIAERSRALIARALGAVVQRSRTKARLDLMANATGK